METVLDLQSLFSARQSVPSPEQTYGTGHVVEENPMAFLYKGRQLDFTVLHVALYNHPAHAHARAVVEGHYGDLKDRAVSGHFYEDRNAYESLLKNNEENPRPAYIHALMLEHRGLYFRPESLDIDGYGSGLWFSGLIPRQKGLKPTETPTSHI